MYDFLEPGGILINMDLFNYGSEEVKKQAHLFDIEYIKREFDHPSPAFKESRKLPVRVRKALKEKWVKHMEENNILDTMESQMEMLREIGFRDVECVLRYWQQGVLYAQKPGKP